jgi:outer membrane lipoprotein-sorting protein
MKNMKRVLFLMALIGQMTLAVAQNADYQKAVARYKNSKNVTAVATKITHKAALAKDETTKGKLTMKQPSEVGISMEGGKDALLMQGSTFTMTVKGKKHTTDSQKNRQFATFQAVFESILSGGAKDISKFSDLSITKQGSNLILTITPEAASKKEARRMMFTSFTLTIDTKTSELRSLRMNEKAGNYTEYKFSNFAFQ